MLEIKTVGKLIDKDHKNIKYNIVEFNNNRYIEIAKNIFLEENRINKKYYEEYEVIE